MSNSEKPIEAQGQPTIAEMIDAAFIAGCKLYSCEMALNDRIAAVVGSMKDGGEAFLTGAENSALKEFRRQGRPLGLTVASPAEVKPKCPECGGSGRIDMGELGAGSCDTCQGSGHAEGEGK